ncbi:hypothetical protein NBRC10513v2_001975 [Rhodotorula toruloides]
MLQLPIEVFEHVLELSLPPAPLAVQEITSSAVSHHPLACWSNWKERSRTLKTIALINRHCAQWTQRELWRHVLCLDNAHVELLLKCTWLADERNRGRRRVTETVRLGSYDYGEEWAPEPPPPLDGSCLSLLLRALQPSNVQPGDGIKELWLTGMHYVDLRGIWHLQDLNFIFHCGTVSFPKLKAIHCPADLPPDWLAPFNRPRWSYSANSGDPLLCLCLDDEILQDFATVARTSKGYFRHDLFQAFDATLGLPAMIVTEAVDFRSSLRKLHRDLFDQFNALLEGRHIRCYGGWVSYDWERSDFGGVGSINFLSGAEWIIKKAGSRASELRGRDAGEQRMI